MIASLPMYDLPELAPATDAWWAGVARALVARGVADVPPALDRGRDGWDDPSLLVSQTCGYVLQHRLRRRVRLVATPRYRAAGCDGPRYRSVLVVRRDDPARSLEDLRGRAVGVNQLESHSGMNALRHAVAPLARGGRFFGRVELTGGHRASLARVGEGTVDVAAIDCVTFALLERAVPALTAPVRVLAETASAPGLPLVTRAGATDAEVARLVDALRAACADPTLAAARDALLLDGIDVLPLEAYEALDALEADAIARAYPVVA